MRKLFLTFRKALVGFGFVVQVLLYTGCVSSSPSIKVRDSWVVGDELRLIVETSVSHDTFASHSSTVSDVASYAMVVNLSTNASASSGAHLIGPLYRNPANRSDMAYNGIDFTERDRLARASTPRIYIDDQGDFARLTASGDLYQRERLELESHPPQWVPVTTQSLPPLSMWHTVYTASRRWAIDYEPEKPRLYDMRTGQQRDDPWLEAALIDFRARTRADQTLRDAHLWLSEDLNHLVVTPLAGYVNRDGSPATFGDNGRRFSGDEYGLEYVRPTANSRIISKRLGMDGMTHAWVQGVFMIQNEPFLLYGTSGVANLATLNGETRFRASLLNVIPGRNNLPKSPNPSLSESDWQKVASVYHFDKVIHQPESERLVFVDYNPQEYRPHLSFIWGSVDVILWHYPDSAIRFQRVNLKDFFRAHSGEYQARQVEGIGK